MRLALSIALVLAQMLALAGSAATIDATTTGPAEQIRRYVLPIVELSPAPSREPSVPITTTAELDWIHLTPATAQHWRLTTVAGDASRATVEPREIATQARARFTILLLYTKSSSAYDTALSKMLEIFREKQLGAVFSAIMLQGDRAQGDSVLEVVRSKPFDLIFAMGSDATALLYRHAREHPVPVVSVSAKDPVLLGQMADYQHGSGTNMAFTSLNMPVVDQITYLKELKPDVLNVAVLYASSNTSAIQTQVEPFREVAGLNQLRMIDVVVEDDARAAAELVEKIPGAIKVMQQTDPELQRSIFWITGSTSVFEQIATIARMAAAVPVLSAVPDIVQEGDDSAVLSIGVSFESNAHLAALYAVAILTGSARAGELPVGVVSPPDIAINFRRARALGMKIPFRFFESASYIYDDQGKLVRREGQAVREQ